MQIKLNFYLILCGFTKIIIKIPLLRVKAKGREVKGERRKAKG